MTFKELRIIPPILKALEAAGYEAPTPIQEAAIPPVLQGRDLLGCAQTGTGKTAAFAVPVLQRLAAEDLPHGRRPVRALVLTPTRELALQILESFEQYGSCLPLQYAVVFGGVGQAPQVAALQSGVDVLVATPGRLNDLIGQGLADLSRVEIFVLDEADRMLDMGFLHDVRRVIDRLPEKKQTLLFSATMPAEIQEIADRLLHDMAVVQVDPPASTVEAIRQFVCFVDQPDKRRLLAWLLQKWDAPSVLVFTRTKHGADRVARDLNRGGFTAQAIHGNKSQSARQAALTAFKQGQCRVLVATDIAARGIDIEELALVVNYDIPNVPETYVHRIGRTGRAGLGGTAVAFCAAAEREDYAHILRLTGGRIEEIADHPFPPHEDAQEAQPAAVQHGTSEGGRRSRSRHGRRGSSASGAQAGAQGKASPAAQQAGAAADAPRAAGHTAGHGAGHGAEQASGAKTGEGRNASRHGRGQKAAQKTAQKEAQQGAQKSASGESQKAGKTGGRGAHDGQKASRAAQGEPNRAPHNAPHSAPAAKHLPKPQDGPAPRRYSEQMHEKQPRRPKKYEYHDTTRLKDDIVTYTPDWGAPARETKHFQPSASARKKPQDQPLSRKPYRR